MNRHYNEVYAKVKKLQVNPRTKNNIVKNKEGRILFNNEKVAKRWKECIVEIYEREEVEENVYIEKEEDVDIVTRGPYILKEEFQ